MDEHKTDTIPAPPHDDVRFVGDVGPLFEALAKAQGEFPAIEKTNTAEVKKEGRLLYTNEYAPLDVIIAACRPALAKHGLSVAQFPTGSDLVTVLAHGAGRIEARCQLPNWETSQQLGGVVTYLRRYTLLAVLGVFPGGEDDDSNQASGQQATITQRQRPPQVAARPAPKEAPAPAQGAVTAQTKSRAWDLAQKAGFNTAELEEFSKKHQCGALGGLSELNGLRLVGELEKLQVSQ